MTDRDFQIGVLTPTMPIQVWRDGFTPPLFSKSMIINLLIYFYCFVFTHGFHVWGGVYCQ